QASAIKYFRCLFTENTEPPKYFDQNLIDVFIDIVRDMETPVDVRTDAAWAITNLLCSKRTPLTHDILDKGTLDVFVWCIRTADSKLRDQCIWGVGNISADCPLCKEAVRSTDALDLIAKQMNAGEFHTLESNRCAIWCCLNILRGGHAELRPETARALLTAVTAAMLLYEDSNILQDSLLTLSLLADDRNFFLFPHLWPAQIDAMINEPGLVSTTLLAIDTGKPSLVSPALRLIGNIITGTDDQTERVIMRDGFVGLICKCIDSSVTQVRREAAWILSNIAAGPAHHVDLILTNPALIGQLLQRLHHDDVRMKKEVSWVFANVLSSLNTAPRPAQMSEFLGYGVLAIVDFATMPGVDTRLVNKIREVLSSLLIVHPEFWRVVEKAGSGSTPLLELPRRKKRVADYVIYDEDAMEI
ncbi:hypothetical protein PMAYCL1PPCAC_06133, partial [Pristionchus mayeri]